MKSPSSNLRSATRLIVICVAFIGGCIGHVEPDARPVTAVDPNEATVDYWFKKPAVDSASCRNFDKLWNACVRQIRDAGFTLDRNDPREGIISSLPRVSKQVTEFWSNDTGSAYETMQSTMMTMRRTVRFDLRKEQRGGSVVYVATPKVLKEHFAATERRITSVVQYRDIFSIRRTEGYNEAAEVQTTQPSDYWYADGRDYALEHRFAKALRKACAGG